MPIPATASTVVLKDRLLLERKRIEQALQKISGSDVESIRSRCGLEVDLAIINRNLAPFIKPSVTP